MTIMKSLKAIGISLAFLVLAGPLAGCADTCTEWGPQREWCTRWTPVEAYIPPSIAWPAHLGNGVG